MRKFLLALLTLALLSGCNTVRKNASPSPQSQRAPSAASTNHDKYNRLSLKSAGKSTVRAVEETTDLSIKDHLETMAEKVPGVKKAHAVVFGNTAVVGIDVDGKLSRSRVGNIKYSVAETLKKDPRGKNALVTADMDLSHRIAEIGQHIQKGAPVSGFASELADIVGRIIPQLSQDVKTRQTSPVSPSGRR